MVLLSHTGQGAVSAIPRCSCPYLYPAQLWPAGTGRPRIFVAAGSACGIDHATASRLERSEINATLTDLMRLSKGLCIPLRDLIDMLCQAGTVDEKLVGDLRPQLRLPTLKEQQFVLDFIRSFFT